MIKRLLIAIVLLALVGGGIVGFNLFRANAIKQYFATMKQPASAVSTITVKPQKWQPGIDAVGTVNARQGVDVSVETSGTVTAVNFKANQEVEKGGLLVQLDDEVERADLASAQSALKLAQENLERARQLTERGVSATSSLQSAQSEETQAQSTVQKLKAVLDQKQLRAPFSGTIGIPKIDLGQYLTVGTAVATLQDLKTMRVDFTVPEQEFSNLHLGQDVGVGFDDGKYPYQGQITGINPKIDPSSRLVTVRGEIDNSSGDLRPGQFVRVRVALPVENNVIALPQTTVTTSLYGDYVFVVRKADSASGDKQGAAAEDKSGDDKTASAAAKTDAAGKAEPAGADKQDDLVLHQVFVGLGRHNDQQVEITRGLEDGDVVVTSGENRLSNGMAVKIDNKVTPTKGAGDEAVK